MGVTEMYFVEEAAFMFCPMNITVPLSKAVILKIVGATVILFNVCHTPRGVLVNERVLPGHLLSKIEKLLVSLYPDHMRRPQWLLNPL